MVDLLLHGRQLRTVFDLLGSDENDITYSVGWALSKSSSFLDRLLADLLPGQDLGEPVAIRLQEYSKDGGYTDIEVETAHSYLIVEAKRGWALPGQEQLEKYAARLARDRATRKHALVVMTECSPEFAARHLPPAVKSFPILHRSWKQVHQLAKAGTAKGTHAEKRLLLELTGYLEGLMSTQNQTSNLVYVVSLSSGCPSWSATPWIDIVEKHNVYFHPFGGSGWPRVPLNYVGFRHHGELQSVRHVEGYRVVDLTELASIVPKSSPEQLAASEEDKPHFVYQLGAPIRPGEHVKTGKGIVHAGRVWAAIDLLLTCKTISEARDLTRERIRETEELSGEESD